MTPQEIKNIIELLDQLEWHYVDKISTDENSLSMEYYKHVNFTLAAKVRELRALIYDASFTSKITF